MQINNFLISLLVLAGAQNLSAQSSFYVENEGQFYDQNREPVSDLLYMGNFNDLSVQLFEGHFNYEIKREDALPLSIQKGPFKDWNLDQSFEVNFSRIEFHFPQNSRAVLGHKKSNYYTNYFLPQGHFKEIASFEKVIYDEISPGIDMEFIVQDGQPKYNIILSKVSDLNAMVWEIKGGERIYLDAGELVIETKNGTIRESIPLSFTQVDGQTTREVNVSYILEDRSLKFHLEESLADNEYLFIDPIPNLEWGTYTGGPDDEYMEALAIDTLDRAISAGFSSSTSMIATTGAYDETMDGVFDVAMVCYDNLGNKLWGTYWGGAAYDRAYGIDISDDNNIYLTGNTFSPGMGEPSTVHQDYQVNGDEAFAAKFDANGFKVWSTYYGGDQHDFGANITVDADNNCYITGHTYSTTEIAFAGTSAPFKAFFSGISNAFIAKFKDDGTMGWASYYGEALEEGWGIDVDGQANVYISGGCQATFGIATPDAHDFSFGGFNDAFLSKWDSSGVFEWGTYYGDSGDDASYDCVATPDGHCYIAGTTSSSTEIAFGAGYQPDYGASQDGFCAKFDTDGANIWGTYVGGNGADYMYSVDMGIDSNVVVAGMSLSTNQIALPDSYDDSWEALYDAVFVSIDSAGGYRFGTYYGNTGHDECRDVAVSDRDLMIYMAGRTQSTTGMTTSGAESETYPGGLGDTFLSKWCNPILIDIVVGNSTTVCSNEADTLFISEPSSFTSITWSTAETADEIYLDGLTAGEYTYYADGVDTNGCVTRSDTITINAVDIGTFPVYGDATEICQYDSLTMWTDSTDNTIAFDWLTGGTDSLDIYTGFSSAGLTPYWVIVTDSNGCVTSSDTAYVNVLEAPDPTINTTATPPFCEDDVINVNVAPTDDIEWSNTATTNATSYSWGTPGTYEITVITTNVGGCSAYDTIVVDIAFCLGIGEEEILVNIYPNPVEDLFIVEVDRDLELSVYNAAGQIILSQTLSANKKHEFDLSPFASGTYSLNFSSDDISFSRKIVKIN